MECQVTLFKIKLAEKQLNYYDPWAVGNTVKWWRFGGQCFFIFLFFKMFFGL